MPNIIAPAGWYRRQDYDRIRKMMDDPDNFPETFEEWLHLADSQVAQVEAQGMTVEKVIIDPDAFAAFCREAKIAPDNKARVQYAVRWLSNQNPGHG